MISVTIVTKNFRFLYTINENLANIETVKTSHILPEEQVPENTQVIITTEAEKGYKHIIKTHKNKILVTEYKYLPLQHILKRSHI